MVVQLKVMGETGQGNCLHLTIELNLEWNKIAGLDKKMTTNLNETLNKFLFYLDGHKINSDN